MFAEWTEWRCVMQCSDMEQVCLPLQSSSQDLWSSDGDKALIPSTHCCHSIRDFLSLFLPLVGTTLLIFIYSLYKYFINCMTVSSRHLGYCDEYNIGLCPFSSSLLIPVTFICLLEAPQLKQRLGFSCDQFLNKFICHTERLVSAYCGRWLWRN